MAWKAQWVKHKTADVKSTVTAGALTTSIAVYNAGVLHGTLSYTLTADLRLDVLYTIERGQPPVDFAGAWVKGA